MKKLLLMAALLHAFSASAITSFERDALFYSGQLAGIIGAIKLPPVIKKFFKNSVDSLYENKQGIYIVPSEKTKKFFEHMLQDRKLQNVSIKMVAGFMLGGCEDYMALSLGNNEYAITLPREKMLKLNELLEKELLTEEEQQELYAIEFFVGHEMHHVNKAVQKRISSSLCHATAKGMLAIGISTSTWALLRNAGVDTWWKLMGGVAIVNLVTQNSFVIMRSLEESECDLNASKNRVVLKAGSEVIKNHHISAEIEQQAKNVYGGLIWKFSENCAYVLGTQHPSPKKRSQDLIKKVQALEAEHNRSLSLAPAA